MTALIIAAQIGDKDIVNRLLEISDIDINHQDVYGNSADSIAERKAKEYNDKKNKAESMSAEYWNYDKKARKYNRIKTNIQSAKVAAAKAGDTADTADTADTPALDADTADTPALDADTADTDAVDGGGKKKKTRKRKNKRKNTKKRR